MQWSLFDRRHWLLRDESSQHSPSIVTVADTVNGFSASSAIFYRSTAVRYSLPIPFCPEKTKNRGTWAGVLSSTKQSGRRGNAKPKIAEEFCATGSKSQVSTQVTLRFSRISRALRQSSQRKNRALSVIPDKLSCELPATPGCSDQYAIDGESHHGAKNGRFSDDCKLTARSRNRTDSFRCSIRRAYSASLGQSCMSQSRKIGKTDITKATQTAVRDLIGSSKSGSAIAKTETEKYAQRPCQIVRP